MTTNAILMDYNGLPFEYDKRKKKYKENIRSIQIIYFYRYRD